MKKLPKKSISPLGFTLIELLVVVAIIAILSAVGVTIFTNAQKGARDAQRKADINSIASAYESRFNFVSGQYPELKAADFQSGKMPVPPGAPTEVYNFVAGPNKNLDDKGQYKVCATLGDRGGLCYASSSTCYCRSSSQSAASAAGAGQCNSFLVNGEPGGNGSTQTGCWISKTWSDPRTTDLWIKCSQIAGSINCSDTRLACFRPAGGNMPWYTSATVTSPPSGGEDLYLYQGACTSGGALPDDRTRYQATLHLINP